MTWDSSKLTVRGNIDLSWSSFKDYIPIGVSVDGLGQHLGGLGTVTPYGHACQFLTHDNGDYSYIISRTPFYHLFETGKKTRIEWLYMNSSTSSADFNIKLRAGPTGTYPPTDIGRHVGFIVLSGEIYTSSGNGTNGTAYDTGLTLGVYTRLRIEYTPGTSCEFYINETLVKTLTTTLPSAGDSYLTVGIEDDSASSADKAVYLGRIYLEKEY
jgi:hypothetical protein